MIALFLKTQTLLSSGCLSLDKLLWTPPYCVLRQTVSLNLSFLKCKLEIVIPTYWVTMKAKRRECLACVEWSINVDPVASAMVGVVIVAD